jgi:hypothetical protein
MRANRCPPVSHNPEAIRAKSAAGGKVVSMPGGFLCHALPRCQQKWVA